MHQMRAFRPSPRSSFRMDPISRIHPPDPSVCRMRRRTTRRQTRRRIATILSLNLRPLLSAREIHISPRQRPHPLRVVSLRKSNTTRLLFKSKMRSSALWILLLFLRLPTCLFHRVFLRRRSASMPLLRCRVASVTRPTRLTRRGELRHRRQPARSVVPRFPNRLPPRTRNDKVYWLSNKHRLKAPRPRSVLRTGPRLFLLPRRLRSMQAPRVLNSIRNWNNLPRSKQTCEERLKRPRQKFWSYDATFVNSATACNKMRLQSTTCSRR